MSIFYTSKCLHPCLGHVCLFVLSIYLQNFPHLSKKTTFSVDIDYICKFKTILVLFELIEKEMASNKYNLCKNPIHANIL